MRDPRKILKTVVYLLAVLIVSLAVLVALILLLESRDQSSVEGSDARPGGQAIYLGATEVSRANATIRLDAL